MTTADHHFGVSGVGRSGTMFASWLLNDLGIRCSHEFVFNIDRIRHHGNNLRHPSLWDGNVGDSSNGIPAWYSLWQKQWPLAHVTRHPYRVIASWWQTGAYSQGLGYAEQAHPADIKWRQKHCPQIFSSKDEMGQCINHVHHWGMLCDHPPEGVQLRRFKAERLGDDPAEVQEFVRFLMGDPHVPSIDQIVETQQKFGKVTNTVQGWEEGSYRVEAFDSILERILDHPLHWKATYSADRWGYSDDGEDYV